MFFSRIKWPETVIEAKKLQEIHRRNVNLVALGRPPVFIAGVDAAYGDCHVFAVACIYHLPELSLIDQASSFLKASFPYIPGYLFFREGPAIIDALKKLTVKPDVILVDGHGIAHPRGIGSASHLGLLLDIPTIGCAKARLVGDFAEPDSTKGSLSPLIHDNRVVGSVLRTRNGVKPIFVSPGHKIDIEGAIRVTLACLGSYRIPEPLRCADILSKKRPTRG